MMLNDATDLTNEEIEPLKNTTYRCMNCKFWNRSFPQDGVQSIIGLCLSRKCGTHHPPEDFGCVYFQPRCAR